MSAESNGNSTMTTEKVEQEGRGNAKIPVPLLLVLLFLVFFLGGFTYLVLSSSKAPRFTCVHGSDGEASCNLIITKPVASKIGTIRVQRESDIFISLEKPFVVERPVTLVNGNTLPAGEYWKLKIKSTEQNAPFMFQLINESLRNQHRGLVLEVGSGGQGIVSVGHIESKTQ